VLVSGDMDLDLASLFTGFLVSGVGFVLFRWGRKMGRPPQLITGLLLMVYPYFVGGVWAILGVGVLLGALLWALVRLGL